jgi:protein transport protein SEC23
MRVGISVSKGLKISGALGTCVSLKIKNDQVSETVIGEGGTVEWYVGTADHTSTLGFVFENEKIDQNVWMGKPVFIQLRTIYKHSSG